MEVVNEYNEFVSTVKLDLESNLFGDTVDLSLADKRFIRKLMVEKPNVFFDILHIKTEFPVFHYIIIPFLVNKVADMIIKIVEGDKLYHLDTFKIISFLSYSSIISFFDNIEPNQLDLFKLSIEVSTQLLKKNVKPPRYSFFCGLF